MKYQISKGTKSFGVETVFENIQFEIKEKEKIAVVGRNGCGKTTLLKIIAGVEELDSGTIHQENRMRIGYLAQTTFEDESRTAEAELKLAFAGLKELESKMRELSRQMEHDYGEALLDQYARVMTEFEERRGYTWEAEMHTIFTKFGFAKEDLQKPIYAFSGGQKTRLGFVKLLLSRPDILLLDEPTNHLDLDTIEWLEGYVKHYPKAVVLVSHDRMFLDDVCDVIYELEFGVMRKYVGNYTHYVEMKKQDVERAKSAYARQQQEIKRMEELIEKFRYKKNKAAFAQSKIKYLERMEKVEEIKTDDRQFAARFTPRVKGGRRVLSIADLHIGYDHDLAVIDLTIMQGEKVAVIGPNGKGKSTFVKTLMQQVPARSGEFLLGHQIEIGYFDQELAQFQRNATVLEEVWNAFPHLDRTQVRTALGRFLFSGEDVFKTTDVLSGGGKVRLSFVKLMLAQPNFLILDEPTNHLDLAGKEALENALREYEGTMLFVSHDRYFIRSLATAILVIDAGKATYYPLSYAEYLERLKQEGAVHEDVVAHHGAEPIKEKNKKVRLINYAKEAAKLEKQIARKEQELEDARALRFEPEYYHDYQKMQALDEQIDEIHNEIEHLLALWETYSEQIDH